MSKAVTPKKLVHYAILFTVAWVAYRYYTSYQSEKETKHRPYGPRDLRRGKHHRKGEDTEDFQHAAPVDLDKRLKEIEKELERQKRLNNQQRQSHENDKFRGNQDHLKDESNIRNSERDQQEKEYQRKEAREKEERVERNSLGNAKKGVKESNAEAENVDKHGQRKKGSDNDIGKGDKRQVLPKDEEKPAPDKASKKKNTNEEEFQVEPKVDWELEEELQRRRKKFLKNVELRAEDYKPELFESVHELDDHLAFVTAGSDDTWGALQQFIYSVQYFYPESEIGIFDLGFSKENKEKLETYCSVTIMLPFKQFWPEHMKDPTKSLWRPMVWQMGLSHFGHIIYVEPGRFIYENNLKHYIQHSLRKGISVVGKKLNHSPFVVTHPEMYYFFNVDTRKLQRVSMFDITMLVLHNSEPVRHELMRYLITCVLEEYCISPPGAQTKCNHRFFGGSKKYADCHRYEMSALNILVNKWFDFHQDEYLVRDIATRHYDGTDVSNKIQVCKSAGEPVKEEI